MSLRLTEQGKSVPTGTTPIAIAQGGALNKHVVSMSSDPSAGESAFAAPAHCAFEVLPEMREGMRDVIMVLGASGTGKSTWSSQYAQTFMSTFKRGKEVPRVLIVCPDDPKDDPAFRKIDHIHVDPKELAVEPLELEDLVDKRGMPSLIIFDDVEALSDRAQQAALERFSHAVLERGRKKGLYVLYISHRAAAGKATKIILQEQTAIWLPTGASSSGNLSYMLEKHVSVPGELRKIFKQNADSFGRWVYLKTDSNPRFIVSPKRCCIFDPDEIEEAIKTKKAIQRQRVQATVAAKVSAAMDKKPSAKSQLRALATQVRARKDSEDDDSEAYEED